MYGCFAETERQIVWCLFSLRKIKLYFNLEDAYKTMNFDDILMRIW